MRFAVRVLACVGAGAIPVALADPSTTAPDTTTAPAAASAPAAAAPQSDHAAPAVAKPATDVDEKRLIGLGYKPEMRNGEKIFCRRELALGSRIAELKHCGTVEQLRTQRQETHDVLDKIQRTQANPTGS